MMPISRKRKKKWKTMNLLLTNFDDECSSSDEDLDDVI